MATANYGRLVVSILIEAGKDGLSVKKITRHVYNAVNGFFEEVDLAAVHRQVQSYLYRHSKGKGAAFKRLKHGTYCLNRKTLAGQRMEALVLEEKEGQTEDAQTEEELFLPFGDD